MDSSIIKTVESHKHLGLHFSNDGSWKIQIDGIIAKAKVRQNKLRRLKFKADRKRLEVMYFSYVRPILEYADVIWDNCQEYLKDRLEQINYEAARIVTGATKLTRLQILLKETGWETLRDRRKNHKLILFHQMANNNSPAYLSNLVLTIFGQSHPYGTRNAAICKVCKTKTFNILESFPNMMDIIPGDEDSGEIKINDQMDIYPCDIDSDGRYLEHKFSVVEQNQPTHKCMQSEDMTAKEENDMISEDEASIWISQSDSENYTVSLPSSQISSWSTENDIQRNTLEEINSALNIIGGGKISPITYQIRKDVNELKPRTVRSLKRKASATVHEALDCLAPFQKKVWQLIDMDLCSTPSPKVDELVVQLFKESTDKCTKKQFLSMISLSYTKQQLRDIFPGISIYEIDQARMHAKTCGKGVPPPNKEKCVRQKMNKDKLDHALDFFLNPSFHQVTSVGTKQMHLRNGEVITIPQVVRTACHSTLVTIYQSFCQETDFSPLSRATLFKILAACPASKRTNLKGLDNVAADGALGFETLLSTLASIERYVSDNDKLRNTT